MLENAAGRQLMLVAPLSGEVTRRNDALLAATPDAPAPRAAGAPLWLWDITACDAEEWDALPAADT